MPELTNKQKAFCREYVKDHNGTQAAIRAGYSKNGANVRGTELLAKSNIKAKIDALEAQKAEKIEHTFEIAAQMLRADYNRLESKANAGDIQAIQARASIMRELDSIAGLHSITNINRSEQAPEPLSEDERARLKRLAASMYIKVG